MSTNPRPDQPGENSSEDGVPKIERQDGLEALAGATVTWPGSEENRPHQWSKWVIASYLRRMGATQADVASATGVSRRTIVRWENDDRWGVARRVARDLWDAQAEDLAMAEVIRAVRDDDDTTAAKWLLDNLREDFGPQVNQQQAQAVKVEVNIPGPDRNEIESREIDLS